MSLQKARLFEDSRLMCGIFGVVGATSEAALEACARTLKHRGPDAFGSYFNQRDEVYLAHCRLAIIDLSEAGNQPMANEDGSIWLSYNGEIYNFMEIREELVRSGHRFRSRTDSEVVVHAYEEWGIDCVKRFNGMFAFAIWDERNRKLLLARDRIGIKPLYFYQSGSTFAFASEPKALLGVPGFQKSVDPQALESFLIYRYVSGPRSIWEGIERLGPAQVLTYSPDGGARGVSTYWRLEVPVTNNTFAQSLVQFEAILSASVQSQMISDVPLGVFLSGGIDSSTVAAVAARHKPDIDAFTIGFEGWDRNENATASATANSIGSRLHNSLVPACQLDEALEVFDFLDEPLADSAIFPTYLLSKQARTQVRVVLSGDGGDELFGGYNWYVQTEEVRLLKRLAFALGSVICPVLGHSHERLHRLDKCQHYLMLNSPGFRFPEIKALFPALRSGFRNTDEAYRYRDLLRNEEQKFKKWQRVDLDTILAENNLVYMDRMSMANSLEVRVPLLDHKLVEFAFSLPDRFCINGAERKYLLREYIRIQGLIHVLDMPKRGFASPVTGFWPMTVMLALLGQSHMVRDGLMHGAALEQTVKQSRVGNYTYKIWLLAVLEMWYRKWYE